MKTKLYILMIMPIALALVAGCGTKADSEKPLEEVKAEAENMSAKELESMALAYAKEIKSKKPEVEKLRERLKSLSPKELLGDKGQDIKTDLSDLTAELSALTKRYQVYVDAYAKAGGDAAKVQV